jgi:hypothetical protein
MMDISDENVDEVAKAMDHKGEVEWEGDHGAGSREAARSKALEFILGFNACVMLMNTGYEDHHDEPPDPCDEQDKHMLKSAHLEDGPLKADLEDTSGDAPEDDVSGYLDGEEEA